MKLSTALFWAAVTQLTLGQIARADAPPAGTFGIDRLTFAGTGCPAGSVAGNISPDNQAFTLMFDNFMVQAQGQQRQTRKNCLVDIKLKVPSGWSAGLATADVRGYAALTDPMAFGVVNSAYTLKGARSATTLMRQKFVGPYDGNYQMRSQTVVNSVTYSACGRTRSLRLRTAIGARLSPRNQNSAAMMTVDSLDGEVTQMYGVTWKRCTRDDPEETGTFPDLPVTYSAVCKAVLKNRQGGIVETYEGAAVDEKQQLAQRLAEADARQQCRADRPATPGTICELLVGSCVVNQE